jgi:adenosylhomocysteinase
MMEWINEKMVLTKKACRYAEDSLKNIEASLCFPLEYKTAVLAYELSKILKLKICRFDDVTTKPEAEKWLMERKIEILEKEDCLTSAYYLDCVASLTGVAKKRGIFVDGVIELTRSGVKRLEKLDNYRRAISVDDSVIKGLGENRFGTGWGLIDALFRLNIYLPGKKAFVIGFGRVGEGCCDALSRTGCIVRTFDVDEMRCAIAEYSGFEVVGLEEGLNTSDIIVTATGVNGVISGKNARIIKEGAILCNMGAGRYEIDVRDFGGYRRTEITPFIMKYSGENTFYVIADGNPVNLTIGNGTAVEIMDRTFALAVLSLKYLVEREFSGIIPTPDEVEKELLSL